MTCTRPALRSRPDFVSGIPISREIFPFSPDRPLARFHDHEKPNFLPIASPLPALIHTNPRIHPLQCSAKVRYTSARHFRIEPARAGLAGRRAVRFTIGPWVYVLRVCPGALTVEGAAAAAQVVGRIIYLAGDVPPNDRLEVLIDQLRRLHVKHYGPMSPDAVCSFTADFQRQLRRQGDEPALLRLSAGGRDHGGAPSLAAEPVGCECGVCATHYGAHQITTAAAEFDPSSGLMIVIRCVYCDFCGHLMQWTEGATSAGVANGRVMSGPEYSREHATP